jgi:hypothetical protein
MRMVSRVREALEVELPLRELFVTPTIQSLSTVLETLMRLRRADDGTIDQRDSEEFVI